MYTKVDGMIGMNPVRWKNGIINQRSFQQLTAPIKRNDVLKQIPLCTYKVVFLYVICDLCATLL